MVYLAWIIHVEQKINLVNISAYSTFNPEESSKPFRPGKKCLGSGHRAGRF